MNYSEIKERLILLRKHGFRRELFSKGYVLTIHNGIHHHRRYISKQDIVKQKDFDLFLKRTIEIMEYELNEYIRKANRALIKEETWTHYSAAREVYGSGTIGVKDIKRFCPSDLLQHGIDDCEGEKETEKCERCWNKPYKEEA